MNYYLPLEYVNDYWEHLDRLLILKLYMNRNTLGETVYEFYEQLFELIESKGALPWAFDYVESKSEFFYKHVGFTWFDHGEMIYCTIEFSDEAIDFMNYEYFLDPFSENTTADLIQKELEDECFTESLHINHVDRRNDNYSYGDDNEFQPPILLYVSLVHIVDDMKIFNDLIHKRMFLYKKITSFYKRFETEELIYKSRLNPSY